MSLYADIIVRKSRDSGGGGVLRLVYKNYPRSVWKATTVLVRDNTRARVESWGEDPEDAIYNLCVKVAQVRVK